MLRCATCSRRLVDAPCPDDGWTEPSPPLPGPIHGAPPPQVPGFAVGDPLGAGGFSVVWGAVREADGAAAVIKVGRAATPVLAERFEREAAAMERVGPPHVPRLYGRGRTAEGIPCLIMERLSGETLAAWLARLPRPPEVATVARLGGGILAALAAAHARGVVHRDLKPENIFLAGAGDGARVVLLDLGLVKRTDAIEAELTRSGVAVGTPHYMAPEQITGARRAGAPADVYAFGVVLYELLTLRVPFRGDAAAVEHGHLALRPPRPSAHAPVPAALEELVLACLAKEPERRPASAEALAEALAEAGAEAGATLEAGVREAGEEETRATEKRLIAEGRQPVVIAAIESDGNAREIAEAVTGRGGFVARQRGRRTVAVFSGQDVEDPAGAALAAARALAAAQGARAALHLDQVVLRRRKGAPAAYGEAIERPEAWLPAEPWSGVRWSAELGATLLEEVDEGHAAAPTVEAAGEAAGERSSGEQASAERAAPRLVGRDEVLAALEASARLALLERRPALFTLVGDHGLGKTRLAAEAAEMARRLQPEALVVSLSPRAGGARQIAEELRRALGEQGGGEGGDHERTRALARVSLDRAQVGPVAVVLDDAQQAGAEVLDALEYATLDGEDRPLWVVVAAHPRFEQARPGWGARTRSHGRAALGPLAEPAATALAAELLRPAEYPPAAVLERLSRWSGGNPASLAEIVRALKRAGVVRRRPSTASWYVATADLDALPPSPAWQWLATRRLAALPQELGAFGRLCAVLGATFRREELEAVLDALDRAGRAGTPVDVGYGLRALADEGILERGAEEEGGAGARWGFRSAPFQDALYEMIEPEQRAAVHEHALAYWRKRVGALDAAGPAGPGLVESLDALARHAAAAAANDDAAEALLRLGDLALGWHRHVEADQRYTAALAAAREDDARRRMRALAGRGRCRVFMHRPREAHEDLALARALATSLGDTRTEAEILLEEATALDWSREVERSAERVEVARPLVAAAGSKVLRARLLVAEGRTAYRRSQTERSIQLLQQGLRAGEEEGDYQSQVIALLLLGMQLSLAGRPGEAEGCFERVIALATGAGDLPHLCAAYQNRVHLWLARQEHARAVHDLQRSVALAREIGNPALERVSCLNVAELLYWGGQPDDLQQALALARRSWLLEERFMEQTSAWGALLLARILVATGDHAEASGYVAEVRRRRPDDLTTAENAPSLQAMLRMLELVLAELGGAGAAAGELHVDAAGVGAGWDDLVASAERMLRVDRSIYPDDLLEVLYWCARMAVRAGRGAQAEVARARAAPWLEAGSLWGPRFDDLGGP